ncbi:MAG: 5'/3'-nucleotidase SurE [Anaerolineaceae bacterium]|nr:5'/3'-nucleotidase SurE [Anaerolineaceae bacterium]
MTEKKRKQILLTNDDGIQSPGLWAAAEALSTLGFVTVAAPREQASATGRSLPTTSDGRIHANTLPIGSQKWTVYAVGGTPAQVVLHTVLEIMPTPPDLVVSGINFGENVGHSVTISGTVGAALEAAAFGIPAMAVSLEVKNLEHIISLSPEVDFSAAAHFTHYFAQRLLQQRMPDDVDVLKLDVPQGATLQTAWQMTRLARHRYYIPIAPNRQSWDEKAYIGGARPEIPKEGLVPGTDIHCLRVDQMVSVTPLSLDMTSRVELEDLERYLGG